MEKIYLGQGMKHPTTVVNGSVALVSDSDLIKQSIGRILSTPKGSTFMLPEFGSRLDELMFEPNDEVVFDLLNYFIFEALSEWERRIKVLDCTMTQRDSVIYCTVNYQELKSNEIDSYIYPFYQELKN